MARFPYYHRNINALGRLIAQAASDPDFLSRLSSNPNAALEEIGLPKQTTALMNFRVVKETSGRQSITLPFRVDTSKIKAGDAAYLEQFKQSLHTQTPN